MVVKLILAMPLSLLHLVAYLIFVKVNLRQEFSKILHTVQSSFFAFYLDNFTTSGCDGCDKYQVCLIE